MASHYRPTGYCPSCGYPMDAGLCPECGQRCDVPAPTAHDGQSRTWAISFLTSGAAVLLLMIAILVSEAVGWSDDYYNLPQLLLTVLCFVSAIQYLRTRGRRGSRRLTGLAWLAVMLTGAWLLLVVFVIVIFSLSMSRFDM